MGPRSAEESWMRRRIYRVVLRQRAVGGVEGAEPFTAMEEQQGRSGAAGVHLHRRIRNRNCSCCQRHIRNLITYGFSEGFGRDSGPNTQVCQARAARRLDTHLGRP